MLLRIASNPFSFKHAQSIAEKDKDAANVFYVGSVTELVKLPTPLLVEVYNNVNLSTQKIKKFSDRPTAIARVGRLVAKYFNEAPPELPEPGTAPSTEDPHKEDSMAAVKTKKTKKATAVKRPRTEPGVVNIEPVATRDDITAVRSGSKIAKTIDLLAEGVEFNALRMALGNITGAYLRSFLGFSLRTRTGYGVKTVDGQLKLAYPSGMRAPLPHREPKKAKAE